MQTTGGDGGTRARDGQTAGGDSGPRDDGRARSRAVRRRVAATVSLAVPVLAGIAASAGSAVVSAIVLSVALAGAAAVAVVVAFADRSAEARARRSVARSADPRRARRKALARARRRRVATTIAVVSLFSAGAALSAAAGDVLVPGTEDSTGSSTDTTGTTETIPPTTTETTEIPPPAAPEQDAAGGSGGGSTQAPPPPTPSPPTPAAGGKVGVGSGDKGAAGTKSGSSSAESGGKQSGTKQDGAKTGAKETGDKETGKKKDAAKATRKKGGEQKSGAHGGHGHGVIPRQKKVTPLPLDPEATELGFAATIWLHRDMPDPTPPAKRLAADFARHLRETSRAAGIRWSLVLGVLRAQGHDGRRPASQDEVTALAQRLADLDAANHGWLAVRELGARGFAQQAIALSRFNRAVGLWSLVHGIDAAKERLERRVLEDEKIEIYPGGRADIEAGRIDVRVLVLLRYLRIAHNDVTVSSLFTGHGFFSRPGVPSAHMSGLAVDISMLNGKAITGNQAPGGLTERAVKNVLLLPSDLEVRQVISLLGLGGASFAMADHYDHIHVGF